MEALVHLGRLTVSLALLTFASIAPAEPISKEFDRATLVFRLTVSNPSSLPRHIIKVGVLSKANGMFKCASAASALAALADYPIFFHVNRPETLTVADPVLAIPPKESARFTISLYPNATGACGYWSADVRALVLFDDGTRLESSIERIDAADVAAATKRDPSGEEVIAGLKHRDARIRYQALTRLSQVNLDPITIETLISARLADTEREIRKEAYKKAGELKLARLAPALMNRFGNIPKGTASYGKYADYSSELLSLATALVQLRSTAAIDKILDAFADPDFDYSILLKSEIEKAPSPEMAAKMQQFLKNHLPWAALPDASNKSGPNYGGRYQELLSALIAYRDPASINLFRQIMQDPANIAATRSILYGVLNLTEKSTLTSDPFILAFHQSALAFASHPWGDARINLREPATILAIRTTSNTELQKTLLRAALKDSSIYVRLEAAEEAALLNQTALLAEVRLAYQNSNKDLESYFCAPLKRLGGTCH